jgi:nitroimidazol reductase NimA-like FMN-containing flavoprotein (pyridoxamine 5'-phosphate oxidase superfamily)
MNRKHSGGDWMAVGGSMRRKEFEVRDGKLIEDVLRTAEIGYLIFNGTDGWPRVTPLNFVYDGRIFWHGAIAGERFECLRRDPRATFAAVPVQLYLPSHFVSEENATAATAAFKSIQVRGRCTSVEDPEEKCAILNLLMEKYQPEGRYRKVSPADPLYKKVLSATGVYALAAEEVLGKFKFAQNKSETDRRKIAAKLKERGSPTDLIIAAEILKTF